MKIKFIESHGFAGEQMVMSVDGVEYCLTMTNNSSYEDHAAKLLKEVYNIGIDVKNIKFEWDGSL